MCSSVPVTATTLKRGCFTPFPTFNRSLTNIFIFFLNRCKHLVYQLLNNNSYASAVIRSCRRIEMPRRLGLESGMRDETLVRRAFLEGLEKGESVRILPELNVIKLGGHGTIDYGKEVVIPLVDEIGEASRKNQLLVVTVGGARVRHVLDLCVDLGMPTGLLAELAGKVSEQNAIMLAILFSKYHGVRIKLEDLLDLPMLFHLGVLPVIHGTPPYGLYETPPRIGKIPPPSDRHGRTSHG